MEFESLDFTGAGDSERSYIGIGGWTIVGALACVTGGAGSLALPVIKLLGY